MIGSRWALRTFLGRRAAVWVTLPAGLVLIVLFGALLWRREPSAASAVWTAGGVVALGCVSWLTCAELRRRRVAAELPAVFALAAALYLGEHLVGAVVGTLAAAAVVVRVLGMRHARQDLRRLMADQARWAHRRELGNTVGGVRTVPSDVVAPGDLLVVPCGATVAVDCRLAEAGYFDESALGGRLTPVLRSAGEPVGSGAVNVGPATEMWATRLAEDSAAQRLVRGAERASADRSVLVRLTDLLAPAFLVVVGLLAALGWVVSGQPSRVLAVLAAAALAPLVLAARIAVTAGMSRAARRGAVVPDGRDFDRLARVRPGDQALAHAAGHGVEPVGSGTPDPQGLLVAEERAVGLSVLAAVARRSRRIAVQSVLVGLVLTGWLMIEAALGRLDPVGAAGMQCLADVVVVLSALRALLPPWWPGPRRGRAGHASGDGVRTRLARSS
jgi:cation transport ATPase